MNLAKLKLAKDVTIKFLGTHSASILAGTAIVGVGWTAYETHKATLKADEFLRENDFENVEPEGQREMRIESLKFYIRPALVAVGTVAAIVGSNYISHRKIMGLMAALAMTELDAKKTREKIAEVFGDEAIGKVEDALNLSKGKDIVEKIPEDVRTIHAQDDSKILFCEGYMTGQYFYASMEDVKSAVNSYHALLLNDGVADYADFLQRLSDLNGAPFEEKIGQFVIPKMASDFGYSFERDGLIDFRFTSGIDDLTGRPYAVITPTQRPRADYLSSMYDI